MSNLDYYGKDFFENKVPEVIYELHRIADALEKAEATPSVAEAVKSNVSKKGFLPKCIFVCYEENSVELYNDAGNVSNMYVTTDPAQAKKWAELSLENAAANSFYPVDDDEAENMFNAIGKEDYACTWVYKNKKESSGENYGICVNMYPFSKQPEEAFI